MILRTSFLAVAVASLFFLGACSGDDENHHEGMHDGSGMGAMEHHEGDMEHHEGDMEHGEGMEHAGDMPADLPEGANAVCPVSGDPVDASIHMEHAGKTVYFCCKKCIAEFEKDPAKYMKKAYPEDG